MHLKLMAVLVLMTLSMPVGGIAQDAEEDIVVLKDGSVFRGSIPDAFAPGGAVSVRRPDGSMVALFWSEIFAIKRLPAGIPDSLITQAFIGSHAGKPATGQAGGPRVDLMGYQKHEDILFLNDGSVLRGVQLNEAIDGRTVVWVNGQPKYVPESMVVKTARVNRGVPDSTLIMTYVNVPREWTEGDRRFFSVFAGMAMPFSSGAANDGLGSRTLGSGLCFGIEAGIQLWPGFRWMNTVSYSTHTRPVDVSINAIEGVAATETKGKVLIFLTGGELRTFSGTGFRLRMFAQMGVLSYKETGYDLAIPQNFSHLAGTVTVNEASASAFALSVGGGVLFGRLGAEVRWLYSKLDYKTTTRIHYAFSSPSTIESSQTDAGHQLQLTLSVSIW